MRYKKETFEKTTSFFQKPLLFIRTLFEISWKVKNKKATNLIVAFSLLSVTC